MAYASITYTSASGTTFALTNSSGDPIEYIRQADIQVYVNNVLQTPTTNYTFNAAGTAIVLNSAVSGATVLIQRTTDIADATVVYTAGSTLTAQDLNNADNQLRYGLQEFRDFVNSGGSVPDGDKGDITVAGNGTIFTIDTGAVTSAKIADGTIVNGDINASAAIAGTKISPDFGSQTITTTGVVSAALGAAATPSITFTGDTNTGIYSPGADQVAISTGGSGRLFVNSSGSVGIGTSSPTNATLHVAAAVPGGVIKSEDTGGTGSFLKILADTNNQNLINWKTGTTLRFATSTDSYGTFVEHARIDSSGRLGIGTTTPAGELQISGSGDRSILVTGGTAGTTQIHLGDSSSATQGGISYDNSVDALYFRANGSERARIDSSGRLLVGTSSARTNLYNSSVSSQFQIEGTATTDRIMSVISSSSSDAPPCLVLGKQKSGSIGGNTIIASGDGIGSLSFQGNDGSEFVEAASVAAQVDGTPGANDMPGRLVFSTTSDGASSPTERMRITNDGNILLGTTNTATGARIYCYQTTNASSIYAEASNASQTVANLSLVSGRNTTNGTYKAIEYYNSGAGVTRFQVLDSGNVQNTNNSYTAISDIKLKENIVDAKSQWDDIKALRVRNYNLKSDQTHRQIGVVAQEAELVSPGLVADIPDYDREGNDLGTVTKSVNYSVLYMKAVKALQEAMERIETLEAKIAALESA